MKFLLTKNRKQQKQFINYETSYLILKYLAYNEKFALNIRFKANLLLSKNKILLNQVRRRCLLTGRGNGFFRFFALSRIISRNKARKNLLPFITKFSW